MTGPAPKTRNWRARENKHDPAGLKLIVTGEVEVSATNKHAELTEALHVGTVLPLDLKIVESGLGAPLVVWTKAHLERAVSANEFDRVDIHWDGEVIATAPVVDDAEHDAAADKQAKARKAAAKVKTVAAKKPAPKKAKKASAKKAAGAKVAKKSAKKAAKKATKKATRKTAKKAPKKKTAKKKAAKKSAVARTVKGSVRKLARKFGVTRPDPRKAKKRR
jgi:hypothetical protein